MSATNKKPEIIVFVKYRFLHNTAPLTVQNISVFIDKNIDATYTKDR